MKKTLFCAAIACAALLVACGGSKSGKITKGSLSDEMDSLSYSLGANIGYGMNYQMKDVPFNLDQMAKGIEDAAFEKSSMDHDKALELLRDYFMNKRGERAAALNAKHAQADSVRRAAGDSTVVEYPADPSMFTTPGECDSVSYAFGLDIGYNVRQGNLPLQLVWMVEGLKNVKDGTSKMTEDGVNQYLQYYFMVKRPAENAEASAKWLEKIEKKSGVKKTESGLLYKVEKMGDETVMAKDDRDVVKVHYKGMAMDGRVFDASRLADKPAEIQKYIKESNPEYKDEEVEFALNQVIRGWTEGMKLVGKGGKITLWVPAEMAYGMQGTPGAGIGPNEALQFEVELADVVPYVEPAQAPVAEPQVEATAAPAVK